MAGGVRWPRRAVLVGSGLLPFAGLGARAGRVCDDGVSHGGCLACRAEIGLEARMRYRQCFALVGSDEDCALCGHPRDSHRAKGGTDRTHLVFEGP